MLNTKIFCVHVGHLLRRLFHGVPARLPRRRARARAPGRSTQPGTTRTAAENALSIRRPRRHISILTSSTTLSGSRRSAAVTAAVLGHPCNAHVI